MRCLSCGSSQWAIHELPVQAEIDGVGVKFTSVMFKCTGCGQTSMDDHMYQDFVTSCIESFKQHRIENACKTCTDLWQMD